MRQYSLVDTLFIFFEVLAEQLTPVLYEKNAELKKLFFFLFFFFVIYMFLGFFFFFFSFEMLCFS